MCTAYDGDRRDVPFMCLRKKYDILDFDDYSILDFYEYSILDFFLDTSGYDSLKLLSIIRWFLLG